MIGKIRIHGVELILLVLVALAPQGCGAEKDAPEATDAGGGDLGQVAGDTGGHDAATRDTGARDADPGAADPGAADPGAADPGAADPGVAAPDPGAADSVPASDAPKVPPGPSKKNAPVFDPETVVRFDLLITPENWALFESYSAQGKKEYVHCGFSFGETSFPDAACKRKGNVNFWPEESQIQFVVRFNKWDKKGRFLGLRRLNLEYSNFGSAPVRDRAGMWLMEQAGVPASRVNFARLYLNGAYYGAYQNIEVVDRELLEDRFADPDGNLYKEGFRLKTNETKNDKTRLWALYDLIEAEPLEGDHGTFFAELDKLMNIPMVLREMAVEAMLPTADNFSNGSTNFYYYDDPVDGFLVLPWDLDDAMNEFAPPDADPFAFWGGPEVGNTPSKLRLLMNQNPVWLAEYTAVLVELRDGAYAQLPAKVEAWCQQVRPAFSDSPNKAHTVEEFDGECAEIKQRIEQRRTYLKQVLAP